MYQTQEKLEASQPTTNVFPEIPTYQRVLPPLPRVHPAHRRTSGDATTPSHPIITPAVCSAASVVGGSPTMRINRCTTNKRRVRLRTTLYQNKKLKNNGEEDPAEREERNERMNEWRERAKNQKGRMNGAKETTRHQTHRNERRKNNGASSFSRCTRPAKEGNGRPPKTNPSSINQDEKESGEAKS